jgi:hypothetical protein
MRSGVVTLLLFMVVLPTTSNADCKKARADQTPHGANELIILKERTVGILQGVVFIGYGGGPASDVVVEVYRYEGRADDTAEFLKGAKRSAACLTNENGAFAFARLKAGRYLLRAGTVRSAGINEVHAIFKVTGSGKIPRVQIRLPLGT